MIDHKVEFMPRPGSEDPHFYPPFVYQNPRLIRLSANYPTYLQTRWLGVKRIGDKIL